MVTGLDAFISHFDVFSGHYILIGGGACDWHMTQKGLNFRATKDLDIILVVEALTPEFVNHFWQFIKDGEYAVAEVGDTKMFYRFIKLAAEGYPKMIELFSRRPDTIVATDGMYLTDIPTGEEASSLSAILLDDDYYNFTLANSENTDGLHHASEAALIALKARAFLNNKARKESGQAIQEDDVIKHKRDVIRLTAALDPGTVVDAPNVVKEDIQQFIEVLAEEKPDIKALLKNQGMGNIELDQILNQLAQTFGI